MRKLLGIALAAAIAPAALAVENLYTSGPGLGVAITDDAYNGTLGSMAMTSLNIPSVGADTIDNVVVTVGMNHTWVGDLVIKLESPAGSVLTLLSRPGLVETADDGTGCCGDSSNLANDQWITYDDTAGTPAESLGAAQPGSNDIIPNGSYSPNMALAGLDGQNAVGTWKLYIGDSAGGDTGSIDYWAIRISTVPEPTSLALVALGALGLIRRR